MTGERTDRQTDSLDNPGQTADGTQQVKVDNPTQVNLGEKTLNRLSVKSGQPRQDSRRN